MPFSNMDLIFLIFLILILLILKLKKVFVDLDKITKWSISLASFHFGYLKGACFNYGLFYHSFCVQRKFWANLCKNHGMALDLKISILVLVSQIMVFHFVHFEYKKDFWHILDKLIVYMIAGLTKSNSS